MATPISIRELTKEFPATSGQTGVTRAVDRISLEIQQGELFFLLGPSGCGKTTLLRMIAGFTEPTRGRILFGQRDVTRLPPNKRNTGMVFQSYALWPHMTVEANVAFGLGVRRVATEERDDRVRDALAAVRMEKFASRKPNQLSGGQQQRVALARALVIRPDVLLLDEPLSNLDAKLRTDLRSEIRRICKESGITGIYVTHDQKEALSMADRVAILDHGHVVQLGTPAELYRRPASRFVAAFLGETNFIDGTVVDAPAGTTNTVAVDTPAGRIVAAVDGFHPPPRSAVTCSIRPESITLHESSAAAAGSINVLAGRIAESVYLGDLAQHIIDLAGQQRLRVSELNPRPGQVARAGSVAIAISPRDIVLMQVESQ